MRVIAGKSFFETRVVTSQSSKIEHSENKLIAPSGLFRNETGPGMLQSSVLQTYVLQEYRKHKNKATMGVLILAKLFVIHERCMFVECWTKHSRSNLIFEIRNNLIFRLLCSVRILVKENFASDGGPEVSL